MNDEIIYKIFAWLFIDMGRYEINYEKSWNMKSSCVKFKLWICRFRRPHMITMNGKYLENHKMDMEMVMIEISFLSWALGNLNQSFILIFLRIHKSNCKNDLKLILYLLQLFNAVYQIFWNQTLILLKTTPILLLIDLSLLMKII